MATAWVELTGDATPLDFSTIGSGSTHYERTVKGLQGTGTPNTETGIECAAEQWNKEEVLDLGTTPVSSVSEVVLYVYGQTNTGDSGSLAVDLKIGGSWQGIVNLGSGGVMNPATWRSATYSGTWNQSDLDGAQVKFFANGGDSSGTQVYAVIAKITHTGGGGGGAKKSMYYQRVRENNQ